MKIKYVGQRRRVAIRLSSRNIYYFGPENGYAQDMQNDRDIQLALRSVINKFVTIQEPQKEDVKKDVMAEIKEDEVADVDVENVENSESGEKEEIVIKKRRGRKPKQKEI